MSAIEDVRYREVSLYYLASKPAIFTPEEINILRTLDILCFFAVGFVYITNFQEIYSLLSDKKYGYSVYTS